MKCQVIFLNATLNCPEHIRRENDLIQTMINEQKAIFEMETRDYNAYQREISKQKSHNLWRNRIHIVKQDCCKIHFPDCQDQIE